MFMPYISQPQRAPQYYPHERRPYGSSGDAFNPPNWDFINDHMQRARHQYGQSHPVVEAENWPGSGEGKGNHLGLQNMHITAPEPKSAPSIPRPSSRSANAHTTSQRNSYPPKSVKRQPMSSTYPNTREPSPAYTRHRDREHNAYQEYPGHENSYESQYAGMDFGGKQSSSRPTPGTAHVSHPNRNVSRRSTDPDAGYDRIYGGRTSVPAERVDRYDTLGTSAYDHSLRTGLQRRSSSAKASARAMERSHTMPSMDVTGRQNDDVPPVPTVPAHYRKPRDYPPQSLLQEPPVQMPESPAVTGMDRIRAWASNVTEEAKRHTAGGLEYTRPEDQYEVPRQGGRQAKVSLTRHGSAPVTVSTTPQRDEFAAGGFTEDPDEMHKYREPVADIDSASDTTESESDMDIEPNAMRRRQIKGTPHPTPPRGLPQRRDTLRTERSQRSQRSHQSSRSSPHSHRQATQTPENRRFVEDEVPEVEARSTYEPSIFAKGPAMVYGNDDFPVTPNRGEHIEYVARGASGGERRPISPYKPSAALHNQLETSAKKRSSHDRSPVQQPPAHLAYLYRGNSASPSPHGHTRSASVQPQHITPVRGVQYGYPDPNASMKPKKRSPRTSRSPSPLYPNHHGAVEYNDNIALGHNVTPSRATHAHTQSFSQPPPISAPAAMQYHSHDRERSKRSASRTAGGPSNCRHVRTGFWNRRGDHLTDTGYVVYCPPGRNFPSDLIDYPSDAFMDHNGRVAKITPDKYPEHPESIPKVGRKPERSYDSFIKYVLMPVK